MFSTQQISLGITGRATVNSAPPHARGLVFDFGNSFRPQTQTIKFVSYCDGEQLDPKKEVADTKIN